MSKELEALERLYCSGNLQLDYVLSNKHKQDYESIEQALERLEAIDNADPSEALNCLEFICKILNEKRIDVKWLFKHDYNIIIQALQRLKSIENANLSKALECLEKLSYTSQGYGNWKEYYTTIKQALLKKQELQEPFKTGVDIGVIKPKQYLKWDNLQFSLETKTQRVRMGDTLYKIAYMYYDNTKEVQLLSEDEKLLYFNFIGKYKDNVQLFNDLKLERVEE